MCFSFIFKKKNTHNRRKFISRYPGTQADLVPVQGRRQSFTAVPGSIVHPSKAETAIIALVRLFSSVHPQMKFHGVGSQLQQAQGALGFSGVLVGGLLDGCNGVVGTFLVFLVWVSVRWWGFMVFMVF